MNVVVIGAGKVGRALARALVESGAKVKLRSARGSLRPVGAKTDLVILAVRDGELARLARRLARERCVPRHAAVVHVAGALGPEVLAPLRPYSRGVGQAHPLASFAHVRHPPDLCGAVLLVRGDPLACRRAREVARRLGLVARSWPHVDAGSYHTAAALTAGGAVALVAAATGVLESAGAPRKEAISALAHLLRTVAGNLARLGIPGALTGPFRRGDVTTIARHRESLRKLPEIMELYRTLGGVQLALAESLGEASPAELRQVRALLRGRSPRVRRV
jgi:predicted short-subunit dehydrogenase-like oxidoreductase (DUF2520 family)